MELKELTDRTIELFGVDNPDKLGSALMESISDTDKLKAFCDLVGGDLSVDWMQMIYQYYLADREEKKQDYTPKSLARFMGMLAGDDETTVDMCAAIKIRMNRTAAMRLGYDCMSIDKPDLSASFGVVGQKVLKEDNISFGADDGIKIQISTKDGIHPLILDFLNHWKQMIMYLNNEENRYLAEFRDALLPDLMSGKIEVKDNERIEKEEIHDSQGQTKRRA